MNDWVQIISSLGFPIAMCGVCCWYVKYITDKNSQENKEEREAHTKEQNEFRTALENNTAVMNQLVALVQALVFREKNERGDI